MHQDLFSFREQQIFYRILFNRRDMRHFDPGGSVKPAALRRILQAAHAAPSVGLMQPWRFIHIQDYKIRKKLAKVVAKERKKTARALGKKKEAFLRLKVEGIMESAELLAIIQAPDDGTIFGRLSQRNTMSLLSCACAVENLWLAARAENLGFGWVSIFKPKKVRKILHCPKKAQPLGLLCLGPVKAFYKKPMLEEENWRQGKRLDQIVRINSYAKD
ncbi:5,6-dimethylbenzimidazole synthase [Magnetococcales bacterium HHB-1]